MATNTTSRRHQRRAGQYCDRREVAERFLQRWAAGKRGPSKFSDLELWPIVTQLGLQPDDPVLLAKLLQHGPKNWKIFLVMTGILGHELK